MSALRWTLSLLLGLVLPTTFVSAQSSPYSAYQTPVPYVTTCPSTQYYDIALMQCSPCPTNTFQKATDRTQCECLDTTFYYAVKQGGGSIRCASCDTGYSRSADEFGCTANPNNCDATLSTRVPTESILNGTVYPPSTAATATTRNTVKTCVNCVAGAWSDPGHQRCTPCAKATPFPGVPPSTISCCAASDIKDGLCLTNIISTVGTISPLFLNRYTTPTRSLFFEQHLEAAVYLCRMNVNTSTITTSNRTLLSNTTACQLLANIAAMQLFYPGTNYAYYFYQRYIWEPTLAVAGTTSAPPAIPFLAYPSSYYQEVNSASYNWIPASFSQRDVLDMKLAKYSPTGAYLGLFDAADAYMQLCGASYTDGKPAFTFGTRFKKSCLIRVDALWSSNLYDTAFYDPYFVFRQSGASNMVPTPVVVRNYKTDSDAMPNNNDDEANWVYHRRFFLLDRVSGVTSSGELRNIQYAKSIKILHTLTTDTSYVQPPVIVVEYAEISIADIGKNTVVEVTFETQYRMNLDTHIRGIWIAIGVLCAVGIVISLIETIVWHSRAGKPIIDLGTIGKFLLYLINAIGTIFFIVMAGVSMWWLIFYKRQDALYVVIPTALQQTSFTVLVVVAFVLKTLDILHLIIRQASIDIFFIDWEKSKTGNLEDVSVWRSYFVANEFNEIQSFRRINVSFQLIFVLLLLKVINLENIATAQPIVNLFPSAADYQPEFNGILRVGIAFSMLLAVAVIQFLVYILFYQRWVEDKVVNFIDLCSVSNISIFILMDNLYGFYIHGRSPHDIADVNMKDMMMNLERESNQMIGTRGLQDKSDDQTFIIRVDRPFRSQYELLLQNYQNRILTRMTKKGEEHESEILLASYRTLNDFLCAFINKSLPIYSYAVRQRLFFEKILNFELGLKTDRDSQGNVQSVFLIDSDRNFTRTLFAGYENSLFIWNTATFLFVDYFAMNYVLAAIITYLLNFFAVKLRLWLGQKNLSKKTLIPENFLI